MSQAFSQDAQQSTAPTTLVTTTETNGPATNPIKPPYQNGKVVVEGVAYISTGTGVTGVQVRVRRNINAENQVVNPTVQTVAAAASSVIAVAFQFTDAIPDGRDCSYTLTVQQVAATGNGSILAGSGIQATMLSG